MKIVKSETHDTDGIIKLFLIYFSSLFKFNVFKKRLPQNPDDICTQAEQFWQ